MTTLEALLFVAVIVLIGVCLYLWRAVISKPPKGIPEPIKIPLPAPFNGDNLKHGISILKDKAKAANERLWKLENPPKFKEGDTVYPITGGTTDIHNPLLLTKIEYVELSDEPIGQTMYRLIPEHWGCICFDQTKKIEVYYDMDDLASCQKPKP